MKQHKKIFPLGVRKKNRCWDKLNRCEKQNKENAPIQENKEKKSKQWRQDKDKIERKR